MAEAVARHHASELIEPSSAGFCPLGRLAQLTKLTLLANGYSVEGLSSKPLSRDALDNADLVINLSGEPRSLVFENPAKVEDWKVEDPYGEDPATYQRILGEIESRVLLLASRLRADQREAGV
jgi:protein-tyrosine-phosphatase